MSIFPNPANDLIYITGVPDPTIKIYNILGQQINEVYGADHISIAAFPPGMYFVKVFDTQNTLITQAKVVKQ